MSKEFKIPDKYDYHDWGVLYNTKGDGINDTLEYKVYLWCRKCGAIMIDEVKREGEYGMERNYKGSPSSSYVRKEKSAKTILMKLPSMEQEKIKSKRICTKKEG